MSDLTFSAEEKSSVYNIDKHEFQWCTGSCMTIHWNAMVKKPKSCLCEEQLFILSKTSSSEEFNSILVNTVEALFQYKTQQNPNAISEITFENPPIFVDRWYLLRRRITQSVMVLHEV